MTWERFSTPKATVAFRVEGSCLESVVWGHMDVPVAVRLQQELEELHRKHGHMRAFHHWLEAPTYDPEYRHSWVAWLPRHRGSVLEVHFLSRSRIVTMGIAVANFAIPSIRFAVHTDEARYLRAREKHMSNVPWPNRE